MPKYQVTIVRTVTDGLRGFFDVEAASKEEAERIALEQAAESGDFQFWQCGEGPSDGDEVLDVQELDKERV